MFVLHERLEADTHAIVDWPVSSVRLMNDATYPWLILVPRQNGIRELHELSKDDRAQVMEEITQASMVLSEMYGPDKINVGAIGNMVPQLHIHVVARTVSDPAWPGPVWGAHPPRPYDNEAHSATLAALSKALEGVFG